MHHPAALHFIVPRSRWLVRVLFLLGFLVFATLLVFCQQQAVSMASALVWGLALLLMSGLAWRIWLRMPVGNLRWDGAAWYWSGFDGEVPCVLVLHMDLQHLLIVSVVGAGACTVRLWLEEIPGSKDWMSLRRAVVMAETRGQVKGVAGAVVPETDVH